MTDWKESLVQVLELEAEGLDLAGHVDLVLSWPLSNSDTLIYRNLEKKYGKTILDERIEELLDRIIVGDNSLIDMFPVSMDPESAKKRYRKLMLIFHPDRGVKSEAWLNYRAEKINSEYKKYVDYDRALIENEKVSIKSKSKLKKNKKASAQVAFKYKPNLWRERLGSPQEFQRKILFILIVFASLLLLLVFLANNQQLPLENESKDLVVDLNVDPRQFSIDSYVLNPEAKKILLEADEYFSLNEQGAKVDVERSVVDSQESAVVKGAGKDILKLNSSLSATATMENGNRGTEKILDAKKPLKSVCDFKEPVESLLAVREKRKLLFNVEVYQGPSQKCSKLAILKAGDTLQLLSHVENKEWVYIVTSDDLLAGWVESEVFISSSIEYKGVVKQKAVVESIDNEFEVADLIDRVEVSHPKAIMQVEASNVDFGKAVVKNIAYLEIVRKIKDSYERGDSESMASLYMTSGRENKIKGSKKIQEYYKKAFSRTVERNFAYKISSYVEDSRASAVVNGAMSLTFSEIKRLRFSLSGGSKPKKRTINATFKLVMVKIGDEYKIATFEWIES